MNSKLSKVRCPICNKHIKLDNKNWVVTCSRCKNKIEIGMDDGKIVSVRPYNLEIFLDYMKNYLPFEKWGFKKSTQSAKERIFDSEFCRVKFELSSFNYYPLYETNIYYGRLHAPNDEQYMTWNGEKCLCWHSNIYITLPFIEGVSAHQLADDSEYEIWHSLVGNLKVDYPHADYLEYPLRFHAKAWEHYGEKLFSIFDLRNPELWEEYSLYSNEYNKAIHKKWNMSRAIEKIC